MKRNVKRVIEDTRIFFSIGVALIVVGVCLSSLALSDKLLAIGVISLFAGANNIVLGAIE